MRFGAPSEGGSLKPEGLGDGPEQPQARFVPGALNLYNPYNTSLQCSRGSAGTKKGRRLTLAVPFLPAIRPTIHRAAIGPVLR